MKKSIISYSMAALVALTGLVGTSSVANAGGPDVRFGIYVNDGFHRDSGRGYDRPPRGYDRPRHGCSPRLAEDKAHRMGLRRARVVDVTPRRVVVAGVDRHGRDRVVFANERGCPVIRR